MVIFMHGICASMEIPLLRNGTVQPVISKWDWIEVSWGKIVMTGISIGKEEYELD